MAYLPQEIISDILSRLPVKSLVRFKTVCKSWKFLIQNPNFIKLHLNRSLTSNSDHHLILFQQSIYIAELNLEDIHNPLSFSELHHPLIPAVVFIAGSCNGIFCLFDLNNNNVLLYNPLTNWHRKVPVNYIIDPNTRPDQLIYGFGYDSITDDYKVFSFFVRCVGECTREAQVLSFKTNSWKYVESIFDICYFQNERGVYLDDSLYYVVIVSKSLILDKFVLMFDFTTDTMFRMECPNYDDHFRLLDLSALKGCLCMLVGIYLERNGSPLDRADFWMRKESWVRLFSIRDLGSIGFKNAISTLVFSRDGKKILLEVNGTKFGWYDIEDGSFMRITILEDFIFSAGCTLGSLVSLVNE